MTALTNAEKQKAHRRRMADKMARMTAALTEIAKCHPAWIADNPEWALEVAQAGLEGTNGAKS